MSTTLALDDDDAAKVAQKMVTSGFLHCTAALDRTFAGDKGYYSNIEDPVCANEIKTWSQIPRHAVPASMEILSQIIDVFVLDAQGNLLGAARRLRRFELAVCELQDVDVHGLGREEALAFWLNVFHILTLHSHVKGYRVSSWGKRREFFRALRYRIAGQELSLHDVQHGVLRGNRAPGGWFSRPPFGSATSDRRTRLSLNEPDPRIHFALNVGARSSPTMRVYSAESIDDDLHYATQAYLRKHVVVYESENAVVLPAPFIDFAGDFLTAAGSVYPENGGGLATAVNAGHSSSGSSGNAGGNAGGSSAALGSTTSRRTDKREDTLLMWVQRYLTPERATALGRLIGTPVRVTGRSVDWDYHLSVESHVSALDNNNHSHNHNQQQHQKHGGAGSATASAAAAAAAAAAADFDAGDEARISVEIVQRTQVSMERAREEADADAQRHVKNRGEKQNREGGGPAGNGGAGGRLVELLGAEFDRIVTRYNLELFALGFLSIVVMIVQLQTAWDPERPCASDPLRVCAGLVRSTTSQILKAVITVLTLILLSRIVSYYKFLKMLQRRKFGFQDTLDLSIPWRRLAMELVVCAVHAPPFLDFEVNYWGIRRPFIDDKLGLLVLLRLYLIARVFRDHSTLYHQRKELVAAKGGQIEEVHLLSSFALTVKYLFQRQPGRFLAVTYMSALLLLSYAIYVGERELQPVVFTYANSIWFGITTYVFHASRENRCHLAHAYM
jgi:hypothetical protein